MKSQPIPVYFHDDQLLFHPPYEWDKRGYVPHPESPERPRAILKVLRAFPDDFDIRCPDVLPENLTHQVHASHLLRLYKVAEELEEDAFFFPTFFPKAHQTNVDPENIHNAGFYCFDTSTPLGKHTYTSALWSAASAVQAARCVLSEETRLAYALTRPPGHHADKNYFGGYCYLNTAAIMASLLSDHGSVAIIDIDYHHGDGTQAIFYYDCAVFTASIHADPTNRFPYFSGYSSEIGLGAGEGFNLNVPLPPKTSGRKFLKMLRTLIIPKIKAFNPDFLIIAAGFDTYKDDPICDFMLETNDYKLIGKELGSLNLPTLVAQEGGYYLPALGKNAKTLLYGIRDGQAKAK